MPKLTKEPCNKASLIPFAMIIGYWLWQLWGRSRTQPVLSATLPIMATSLVGGTVYHSREAARLRTS